MMRAALVLLTLLTSIVVAHAESALDSDVPMAIQAELDNFRASCRENGEDISDPSKALRWEDLDGDGRRDPMLDMAKARCTGAYSPYCGTAGCPLVLFRALPNGGLETIFNGQVRSFEIIAEGKRKAMRFQLHGGFCGLAGAENCVKEVRMTGRAFAFRDR